MPRFFEKYGDTFMYVTPVKSLFHSGMIHDVITKGGNFVVNLRTGELTIHRDVSESKSTQLNAKYKPLGLSPAVNISDDAQVARLQLLDQYDLGHIEGYFYHGNPHVRGVIASVGNWTEFWTKVLVVYNRGSK